MSKNDPDDTSPGNCLEDVEQIIEANGTHKTPKLKPTIRSPSTLRKLINVANGSNEVWYGGAGRNRTDDPLLAKQVLSQLSYSPELKGSVCA